VPSHPFTTRPSAVTTFHPSGGGHTFGLAPTVLQLALPNVITLHGAHSPHGRTQAGLLRFLLPPELSPEVPSLDRTVYECNLTPALDSSGLQGTFPSSASHCRPPPL